MRVLRSRCLLETIEMATVIAISTKLVACSQFIHQVAKCEFFCGSYWCYVMYCTDHA
jgi:hypothetical protein